MLRVINGEITYLHVLQKEEFGPGWVYRAKKKTWTDCVERAFWKIRLFGTFWCTTSPDCVSKLLGVWEYAVQTYFSYSLNFLSFPNGSSYFSVCVFCYEFQLPFCIQIFWGYCIYCYLFVVDFSLVFVLFCACYFCVIIHIFTYRRCANSHIF